MLDRATPDAVRAPLRAVARAQPPFGRPQNLAAALDGPCGMRSDLAHAPWRVARIPSERPQYVRRPRSQRMQERQRTPHPPVRSANAVPVDLVDPAGSERHEIRY